MDMSLALCAHHVVGIHFLDSCTTQSPHDLVACFQKPILSSLLYSCAGPSVGTASMLLPECCEQFFFGFLSWGTSVPSCARCFWPSVPAQGLRFSHVRILFRFPIQREEGLLAQVCQRRLFVCARISCGVERLWSSFLFAWVLRFMQSLLHTRRYARSCCADFGDSDEFFDFLKVLLRNNFRFTFKEIWSKILRRLWILVSKRILTKISNWNSV